MLKNSGFPIIFPTLTRRIACTAKKKKFTLENDQFRNNSQPSMEIYYNFYNLSNTYLQWISSKIQFYLHRDKFNNERLNLCSS